tara:strand:- start:878 stop:1339 length:462 start_codon:yes stop_codon:yes gene_type:complete
MNSSVYSPDINLYNIKSKFEILLSVLLKKLTKSGSNILINLSTLEEQSYVDKFLWTTPKDSFIPHTTKIDNLNPLEKIYLHYGDYEQVKNLLSFDVLIVSPTVKFRRFKSFSKFLLFQTNQSQSDENGKKKLINLGFNVKSFVECEALKWKVI